MISCIKIHSLSETADEYLNIMWKFPWALKKSGAICKIFMLLENASALAVFLHGLRFYI